MFRRWCSVVLAAAVVLVYAPPTQAQPAPIEAYGALPAVELVELSPSGRRMALVTVVGEERRLALFEPNGGVVLAQIGVGLAKVRDLVWAGEGHLIITTTVTEDFGAGKREVAIGQLYDVEQKRLRRVMDGIAGVSPLLWGVPITRNGAEGPEAYARSWNFAERRPYLYRINLTTGRGRVAVALSSDHESLVLDKDGEPLAEAVYNEARKRWALNLRASSTWREFWAVEAPLDSPSLVGVGRDGRSVVVFAERDPEMGPRYYEVDPSGVWTRLNFQQRPNSLIFHPGDRTLIGARLLEAEGERYVWFREAAAEPWSLVEAALPDRRPTLSAWTPDLRNLVVHTAGRGDSGTYHFIDLAGRAMNVLGQEYPAITAEKVGDIRAISYAAGDGLKIPAYLTLPPGVAEPKGLALVVLPHGGPESRDSYGFNWWAQAIASRGYAVLQPNFRGSTGFGRAFTEAGHGEWGRKMQTDLSDGVKHLAGEGVVDPSRVCIVGASYGGYAALAGAAFEPDVYRCAVSVAGVSDLRRMVEDEARDGGRRDSSTTRYWTRFMGASSVGDRALDERSPARQADRVAAPVLLIHGKDDTVVPVEQSRLMSRALRAAGKPVELIELNGEDHWLSRSETRRRMLAETIRFLEQHNPPQ